MRGGPAKVAKLLNDGPYEERSWFTRKRHRGDSLVESSWGRGPNIKAGDENRVAIMEHPIPKSCRAFLGASWRRHQVGRRR